jgi:enoyl-CoA hydratase/carnithine racemase
LRCHADIAHMPLPIGPVLVGAKAVAPSLSPEAMKLAKKLVSDRQLKRRAHDIAWQRSGKVGQVTFLDGVKRWVVVDQAGTPIIAVPQYDDGSEDALAKALDGVDLARCMHAPDAELKEQKRREEEQRATAKAQEKAEQQAEKQRRSAEENRSKAQAKAAEDLPV